MRYVSVILVFLLMFVVSGYAKDARLVHEPVGLQDFEVGKTINDIMYITNKKYKLIVEPEDFVWQTKAVDPYLLLAKKYNTKYLKGEYALTIDDEVRYVNFNDYILDTVKYYFSLGHNNTFQFKYKCLRELIIENPHKLVKVHPYLEELKLVFFCNKVYGVKYTVKLNMEELKRLIKNYKLRYGKQTSCNDNNTLWFVNQTQIKISANKPVVNKLHNIDEYRWDKKTFYNIKVTVDILKDDIYADILDYQQEVEDDLVHSMKAEINRRIKIITNELKKKKKPKVKKELYDFVNVDQL